MFKRILMYFLVAVLLALDPGVSSAVFAPGPGTGEVIRLYDADDDFTCTGFFIEPPLKEPTPDEYSWSPSGALWMLTAAHCTESTLFVNPTPNLSIVLDEYARVMIGTVHGKKSIDISLLVLPDYLEGEVPLKLAKEDAKVGELVYFHGFPMGVETIGAYRVMEHDEYKKLNGYMRHVYGGKVESGASGSPILNQKGEVVGILWGLSRLDDKDSFFTPVSKIKQLIGLLDVRDEAIYPDPFM
jgi:hypothetical protein